MRRTAQEQEEITEAIGYIRVSTQEQADSGLSLEAQRKRIQAYCDASGWNLIEVYEDAGVSAKTLKRPEFQKALAELQPGRALVALKLDRLTRSVKDLYTFTEAVQKAGAEWATVTEKYDTTTAAGRMVLGLIATVNQWEREVIGERTASALGTKKERRERLGTTPLGYQTIAATDGSLRLVADPDEQETVQMVRSLRAQNLSYRKIAAALTEAGRPTKRGGRWQAETVALLLQSRYAESLDLGMETTA